MVKMESIFREYDMIVSQSTFSCQGVENESNNLSVLRSGIKAHLRLLADLKPSGLPLQHIRTLLSVYLKYDFCVVQASLAATAEFCKFNSDWTVRDVKDHLRDESCFLPELWSVLRSFVADSSRDPVALGSLNQLCLYLTKIELTRPDLEQEALDAYIAFEDNYPQYDHQASSCIKPILHEWLRDYRPETFPHNGGGSTADAGRSAIMKYGLLGSDAPLRSLCKVAYGNDISNYLEYPYRSFRRCSRLQFVPKTYKKLRSISMEPASLMFFQQGTKDNLYKYIERNLSWCIDLRHQERNREYARLGSSTGAYCTIDLSAASDSVGYALVHDLFEGTTLWPELLGLRSFKTELPDGSELRLQKFAPMGSALCFPTECLIFASVCEFAARMARANGYTPFDFSVYGDDICCPSYMYDCIVQLLVALGFSVNETKSFHSGPYRESCGKEYYNGWDITCIKYRGWDPDRMSTNDYDGLCDHANLAFGLFPWLRRYVFACLHCKGLLPVFGEKLFSNAPTNFHLRTRFAYQQTGQNGGYQEEQAYCRVPRVSYEFRANDDTTYFEWLRVADRRDLKGLTMQQLVMRPDRFVINGDGEGRFHAGWHKI